jgi:hypothetical protein
MGVEQIGGKIRFITEVEDWMREQWSTEVFNFSSSPYTPDEMAITRILDGILHDVVFGISAIDEMVDRARNQPNKLIQGRRAGNKEQHLSTWMGNTFDGLFKGRFVRERDFGLLKAYRGRLDFIPPGAAGPDIFMKGTPMIAWDVTTQAEIERHVLRDSIRRLYDRYYLLIWDEPRTKPNTLLQSLARGSGG